MNGSPADAAALSRQLEVMASTISSALRAMAAQVAVLEAAGVAPKPNDLAQHRTRFPACLAIIKEREGGDRFTQTRGDKGGATKYGITRPALARYRGVPLAQVTVDDIRNLTEREADLVYERDYWLKNRCDQMPAGVDLCVFDFTVPSGGAIVVVQDVLGVTVDGAVGPQTLAAIHARQPGELIEAISAARLAYMRELSTWHMFGDGWTNRVEIIRRAALAQVG
jgi:lysozyme family protein